MIEIWSRETRTKEAGYAAQLIEALPLNFARTTIVLEPLVRRIETITGTIGTTGAEENEEVGDTVNTAVEPLDGTILGFIDVGGRVGRNVGQQSCIVGFVVDRAVGLATGW